MHTRTSQFIPPQRRHWLLRVLLAVGTVAFLFLLSMGISTPVAHADGPGGNVSDPVVRAVDIAKPAVVRIITSLNSHLTVHFSANNSVTFPQGGSGYLIQLSGSGTFISAHGDILTADHVVNPPHDPSLIQFLDMQAAPDVANYINQNLHPNPAATPDQVTQELISGQLASNQSYDPPQSEVFLSTSYTGPLSAPDFQSIPTNIYAPVDRIEQQSSVNQKDVAVIHVSMNDMPSVQLGDSSTVQQQDKLTIIGFPGNGDVSTLPTNLLTSSVNQIFVSSIKTTDTGAQVIQVGGNVEHGDSGGPALDDQGAVVGIVSFALSDQGNTSFLQASNSARQLVQTLNLDTTPGPFEKAWSQAFMDYAATTPGHWHKAQQEFAQLATSYPLFKAVMPYLAYAQAQAKQEQTSPSQPTPPVNPSQGNNSIGYVLAGIGIVAVLLLVLTLFVVGRRNARQRPIQPPQPPVYPPPQQIPASQLDDAMTAFGAPPTSARPASPPSSTLSGSLRSWPCGHMNRSNARYCSICGEPAPPPTITRRVEQ